VAKLELIPGEQILKQGSVDSIKRGMLQMGRGTLTNQRFVRQTQGIPLISAMFGALGVLITRGLTGKVDIDLPLSSIKTLTHGKYRLNKNVLVIDTFDGQSYMLLARFDPWFTAFRDVLQSYGTTLVQVGEKQWAAQR